MKLTKEEALKKIEELKSYVAEEESKEVKEYIIRNRYDNSEIYVSTKDNVREAVIEAVQKGVSLERANLSEADLSESNLSYANLSEADLSKANLSESNLSETDLSKANLSEADLSEADFYKATFYGKGGISKLKKDQVKDFLNALGFQIED